MIAQIKKGEKIVAEILISGNLVSTKFIEKDIFVDSFVSYILSSEVSVENIDLIPRVTKAKVGPFGEKVSYLVLKNFEYSSLFSISFLNSPEINNEIPEEGVVF